MKTQRYYQFIMSRKERIEQALLKGLTIESCLIEDESINHQVPIGAESHFKITIVSPKFERISRIARHRMINSLLAHEFEQGLHALSLHLHTPMEWIKKNKLTTPSPVCQHMDKR